ncbi:MAG: LpqB family beta-propeller domain-containing protein [Streptosporangiaceae bacterium]
MTGGHRSVLRAVLGAAALSLVVTGCVSLPTSGPVPSAWLRGENGSAQQGEQVIPVPPGPDWLPDQIVAGFLAASGTSRAIARQYLAPRFHWAPGRPTILADTPTYHVLPTVPFTEPGQVKPQVKTYVQVTSKHLETLTAGNIVVSSAPQTFSFTLIRVGGQLRIDGISADGKPAPSLLLLELPDFSSSYQPRNLYYFPQDGASPVASQIATTLVPDPVFIQNTAPQLAARQLVMDLLRPPAGWLGGAASTAFPRGTRLLGVQVSGPRAVVDLGGAAVKTGSLQREQMAAQIIWSLTYSPYSAQNTTQIRSVVLQIDHHAVVLRQDHKVLPGLRRDFESWVPGTAPATTPPDLYFQAITPPYLGPQVRVRTAGAAPAPARLPAGLGRGPFSAIAVSPVSSRPAVLAGCRGKNVYVTWMTRVAKPLVQALPAVCTSLSWDRSGDLWIAAGPQVYLLPFSAATGLVSPQVTTVINPALTGGARDTLSSFQIAPDGVRVAMIVRTARGSRVIMAAISRGPKSSPVYLAQSSQMVTVGSSITGARPISLTWWDADHLLVLYQPLSADAQPQLYEVPLNGGPSHQVSTPRGAVSVTAAGTELAVGSTGIPGSPVAQDIYFTNGLDSPWQPLGSGSTAVFPG